MERVLVDERTLTVPVGGGAQMTVPRGDWVWRLRYGRDMTRPPQCSDPMIMASVCDSFRHLIMECSREEAWARIKAMRVALEVYDAPEQRQ